MNVVSQKEDPTATLFLQLDKQWQSIRYRLIYDIYRFKKSVDSINRE